MPITTSTTFNERASRYRCWGDCVHVKTLTIVISCIQIVFSCGNLVHVDDHNTGAYFITGSVIVAAILMLIGVLKHQAALLLPSIIITCIGIFALLIHVFWSVFQQVSGAGKFSDIFTTMDKDEGEKGEKYMWIWYLQVICVVILNIIFFIVFVRCYKYIKDYKRSHQANARIQYSNILQMQAHNAGFAHVPPPSYDYLKNVTVMQNV